MKNILDIFYNYIVPEASQGQVDCWMLYNTFFSTYISEDNKAYIVDPETTDSLVPVLNIKDKQRFNESLVRYVEKALEFYPNEAFEEEVIKEEEYDEKRVCKEKTIMTLAFSNFTPEDFSNPVQAFDKRTEFFEHDFMGDYDLGYSETLKCNLRVVIEKDDIYNEAPYKYVLIAENEQGHTYLFPSVKFGISDGKLNIYAIQHEKKKQELHPFFNKINRTLYKIGEGYDPEEDDVTYGIDNLKDVTSSFVVAATSAIGFFKERGIDQVEVPPILIVRWNAKDKMFNDRFKKGRITEDFLEEQLEKHDALQQNLTEKLIRTFMRVSSHFEGMEITSDVVSAANNLMMKVNDNIECNNTLLSEIYTSSSNTIGKKI